MEEELATVTRRDQFLDVGSMEKRVMRRSWTKCSQK